LASIGSLVISYTDTVVLTYFKSMSDVGIYNVALPTANVLLFFSLSLGFAIFPVISEMHALKLHNDIKKAIGFFYNNIFFLTLPFFIAAFVFSKTIITLLFGINYLDSYLPFQILVIGVFFYSLANINITFLNGTNKPIISTKIIFICACINLVLNILLVPFLGVVGAATSTSFCFFLIFLLSYIYLRKNISFDFSWIMLFKSIFVAVLYFVSLFSLDYFFGAGILKEGIILLMCTLVYFVLGKLLNLENVGGFYSLFFKNKKLQKK
jgi:O-antigen/teichoic acid export membrane protein